MNMENTETFNTVPGFCPDCGSILPLLLETGSVTCYSCKRIFGPEAFGDMKTEYTIQFNAQDIYEKNIEDNKKMKENDGDEGPVVERKCPKCNNDKMSYATLQLRSADEGQTVFYTCTKCKYKENENS